MTWLNTAALLITIIICCTAFIPKYRLTINKSSFSIRFDKYLILAEEKYLLYVVIFLMLAAAAVRLYKFGMIPAGFNQDGALGAVDAYALQMYGTDRLGMRFPVHFTAWGYGQMSVLLSYLSIPFIAVFGLNRFTARIAVLLVSLLAIFVLYKLSSMVWSRKAGIAVLAFCAVNPWQLMQSRWALDCNMFPHFFLFSVYFLFLGLKKNRNYLYISMLLFGVTMYSYGIAWYTVPLFLVLTCTYLLVRKSLGIKVTILSALLYLFVAWPIFGVIIVNYFKLPSIETPLFTIPFFPGTVRTADIIFFSSDILPQLIANLKAMLNVVLLQLPDLPWNTIPEYGPLYLFSIPFAVAGLIYIIKNKKESESGWLNDIILIWAAVALFSGIIINNVNVNRINIIFYPMIIFCGIGIYAAIINIRILGISIAVLYMAAFLGFSSSYFGPHSKIIGDAFYSGFGEALEYANELDADRIYVTNWIQSENSWWISEPLTLFHNRIDAHYFQGKSEVISKSGKVLLPYKERYKYVNFKDHKVNPDVNAAYVINKQEKYLFDNPNYSSKLQLKEFSNFYAVYPVDFRLPSGNGQSDMALSEVDSKTSGNNISINSSSSESNAAAAGKSSDITSYGSKPEQPQNPVANPGFENVSGNSLESWNINIWDQTNGAAAVSLDRLVFKSGNNSVHIVNQIPNDVRVEQPVGVEGNSVYRLSCWIKTKNINQSNKGANLSVSGLFVSTPDIRETNGQWVYAEMYGRTGKNQTSFIITAGIGGYGSLNTGEAWFDDISVQKVQDIPAGTIVQELFVKESSGNNQTVPSPSDASGTSGKPYGPGMLYLLVFYSVLIASVYILTVKKVVKLPQSKNPAVLTVIFISGLILRIILAGSLEGYPNDIATFKAWAVAAANNFTGLYSSGMFLDYPPFYMYVLYIIGKLASLPALSANFTLLVKLPSILSDMAAAYLIYTLAEKKLKAGFGYLAAAAFLFNPAILLNSSIWGMVDSFFMLLVITALLLVVKDKVEYSVIFFAASVLMKPQGIFFLPVLIFALIKKWNLKKFVLTLLYGFLTSFVIILPFFSLEDPLWIFRLYMNTASGYTFASLNAYNLLSLFGANLVQDSNVFLVFSYGTWGLILDVLLVAFSGYVYFKYSSEAVPFLTALLLNAGAFVLSSRMHERYMYPVILLSLLLFIFIKDKSIPLIFTVLTIIVTLNMNDVLSRVYNTASPHIPADDPVLFLGSLANVITFISIAVIAVKLTRKTVTLPELDKRNANIGGASIQNKHNVHNKPGAQNKLSVQDKPNVQGQPNIQGKLNVQGQPNIQGKPNVQNRSKGKNGRPHKLK